MTPTCPQDYTCTFTLNHPRVITHAIGPWYDSGWGFIAGVIVTIAICCLIAYIVASIFDAKDAKRAWAQTQATQKHELEIEEQRMMQIDSAKGNPEMLKMIKEMQRGY